MAPQVGALVKGGAIREFVMWYEARHGRQHLQKLAERLSLEARREIDPTKPALGILASNWYSTALVFPLLDLVTEGLSPAEQSRLAQDATSGAARVLTRGLYRAIFSMVASPRLYARYIQRAWNVLHTTGKRTIVIEREGLARSTIANWPGHHPLLCEITTETIRVLFEAMGCTDVAIDRVACVALGDSECRAIVHYKER